MIVHEVSLYDSVMFGSRWWITQPPPFNAEFIDWMVETFGHPQIRWYYNSYDHQRVRSDRGAGNRGGWELKPRKMRFTFHHDSDGLIFKMKYQDSITSSEVEGD